MKYSVLLDSKYGSFIVPRHDAYYPKYIIETDGPPAAHQVDFLLSIVEQFTPGAVFLDIGANIGHFSISIGNKLNGVVHSYEIQRLVFNMLAGNIAINNLTNVYPHYMAISDQIGQISLPPIDYYTENNFGGYSLRHTRQSLESIQSTTIDSLGFGRIDLIKLDIEGLEQAALIGAKTALTMHKPTLFVEHNLSHPSLIDFIKSFNYNVYDYDGANCFCIHKESSITHNLTTLM